MLKNSAIVIVGATRWVALQTCPPDKGGGRRPGGLGNPRSLSFAAPLSGGRNPVRPYAEFTLNAGTKKLFAFAVVFCLFISGCDSAHPFGKWKKESGDIEEFRIGALELKEYYDTHFFRPSEIDSLNANFIFSGIIDHQFNNDLAENITFSESGMECVVQLRKDVFFHDGSKLTPEDVIYSLNEQKKMTINSYHSLSLTSPAISHLTAESIGDRKLSFKLSANGSLKHNLYNFSIASERYEENYKKKPPSEYIPNGTGPMRFVNYDKAKGIITLKRFDGYYAGINKIKKITIKTYNNTDALEMALLKNEVDFSYIQGTFDKRIKNNKNYAWFESATPYCYHVVFNTLSPKLEDWRVRKALSLLIDRDSIVNDPFGLAGQATPTSVAFSYSYPGTIPVSDKPDTKRAMELFREAGYRRNKGKLIRNNKRLDLLITYNSNNLEHEVHQVRLLGKMWERAGINITLKNTEIITTANDKKNHEAVVLRAGDRFMLSDDTVFLNNEGGDPSANFSDRELERLFLESSKETRESILLEKKALIQQRIKNIAPIVPLYYKNEWLVLGGNLAKNDHLVNLIGKDPAVLRHLSRYVR